MKTKKNPDLLPIKLIQNCILFRFYMGKSYYFPSFLLTLDKGSVTLINVLLMSSILKHKDSLNVL